MGHSLFALTTTLDTLDLANIVSVQKFNGLPFVSNSPTYLLPI